MEVLLAGIADGPTAHSGAQRLQSQDVGGFRLWLRRRTPLCQAQSMDFTDHCILSNAKAAANLARGQFFVPERDEGGGSFGGPIGDHHILPDTKISYIYP